MGNLSLKTEGDSLATSTDTFRKYRVVVQCDSSLPLMSRKIFNVLISLNDEQFGREEVQRISEYDVLSRLKKSRKHIDYYREQFLLLGRTNLEFCVYDENKKRIYGTCSMLSGAVVDEAQQEWIFSTPRKILEWIRKRSEQITLSLSVQHALNSKYSLSLYEVLLCELEDRDEATVSLSPDQIRFITCGMDKNKEYKYLKKQVIKPSLDEVSKYTNVMISIDSEERRNRKVAFVNFNVRRKKCFDERPELLNKLNQEYGVDMGMARKLIKDYSIENIENGLKYTKQKLEEGAIVALNGRKQPNIGGFAVNAIRKGCIPSHTGILEKCNIKGACNAKDSNHFSKNSSENEKEKYERVKKALKADAEYREVLEKKFVQTANGIIRSLIESSGFDNPIVEHAFLMYAVKFSSKVESDA